MSAEETIGFASTQLHPGRQLTLRLMELLDPETFEKFQVLLDDKISPQILENIEVESSYDDVSPGDNMLKRRKFFKALEHQYGEDELIDLLRNVVIEAKIYTTDRDQTVNFKVLLDEYSAKLKDYNESKRSKGLLEDSGFVGREKYIEELKKDLTKKTSNITGVLICGMYGIGKTSLANHLCYVLGEYCALRVDFRAVEDIDQAYRHIMSQLGKMVDTSVNIDLLKSALTEIQTETIIFLDNVDTISDPDSYTADNFMRLLREICSVSNSKVKLLLTSRHKMTKEDFVTSFEARTERMAGHIIEYELRQLTLDECRQIFRTIAPDCQEINSDYRLKELCESCGYSPLGVTMIATLIRDTPTAFRQDGELDEGVKMALTEGQQDLVSFIQNVFNNLNFKWKQKLLELSQFDATFDIEGAMALLGSTSQIDALLDLKYLKSCHLVDLQNYDDYTGQQVAPHVQLHGRKGKHIRITLHTLTKKFCEHHLTKEDPDSMQYAKNRFVDYCEQKLEEIGEFCAEKDITKAHQIATDNDVHIKKCLRMPEHLKKKAGFTEKKSTKPILKRDYWYSAMERFKVTRERMEYFREKAAMFKESGDTLDYIHNKLWELEQHFQENTHFEIKEPLMEVEKALEKEDQEMKGVKLLWTKFKYIYGRYWYFEKKFPKALKLLKESAEAYKENAKEDMFYARIVNMIGSVYYLMGDMDKALKHHSEAYEGLLNIVESGLHFDLPTYILNRGTTFHVKGHNTMAKRERDEYYSRALESYEESLRLYRNLQIYGFSHTANMLQSKATVLCDMKRFHEAVEPAEEAKTIMLLHHPTSHLKIFEICYLTGSIYVDLAEKTSLATADASAELQNWQKAVENFEEATKYVFGYSGVPFDNHYYKKLKHSLPRALRQMHEDEKAKFMEKKFRDYEANRARHKEGVIVKVKGAEIDSSENSDGDSESSVGDRKHLAHDKIADTFDFEQRKCHNCWNCLRCGNCRGCQACINCQICRNNIKCSLV